MTLIAVLIALALDRYVSMLAKFRCYHWLGCYFHLAHKYLAKAKITNRLTTIILAVIPLVVVVVLLQCLFACFWYGIVGMIFNILILFYCLGSTTLFDPNAKPAKVAQAATGGQGAKQSQAAAGGQGAKQGQADTGLKTADAVLWAANVRFFAIIFWFVIFGAVGALVYRLVLLLQDDGESAAAKKHLKLVQDYADWIPVRLLGLGFALVGNFAKCFTAWVKGVLSWPSNNEAFLKACGAGAMDVGGNGNKVEDAAYMVDRTLIVFLVVLALMTLAAWIS